MDVDDHHGSPIGRAHSYSGPQSKTGAAAISRSVSAPDGARNSGLACPYRQKYPQSQPLAPSCLHPFPTMARLKEHLFRCHTEPENQCLRCCAAFDNRSSLESHMRALQACEPRSQGETRMFGGEKKDLIKKRCSRGKAGEERWNDLYRILYPDDPVIPSPYHSDVHLTGFREYARNELPKLLAQELCPDVTPLAGSEMERLIQVLCVCNDSLLSQFQQSQQLQVPEEMSVSSSISDAGSRLPSSRGTPDPSQEFHFTNLNQHSAHQISEPQHRIRRKAVPAPTSQPQGSFTGARDGHWGDQRRQELYTDQSDASQQIPQHFPENGDMVPELNLPPTPDFPSFSELLMRNAMVFNNSHGPEKGHDFVDDYSFGHTWQEADRQKFGGH